jgi:hypothetical protein
MAPSICNKNISILSAGSLDEGSRYDDFRPGSSERKKLQLKLRKTEEVQSRAKLRKAQRKARFEEATKSSENGMGATGIESCSHTSKKGSLATPESN